MSKKLLMLIGILLVCLLISCDEGNTAIAAFEGTWLFPDQGGYSDISVYVDNDGNNGIADIGFTTSTYSYWCYGGGTYSGTVLVGTYDYNMDDSSIADADASGSDYSISITYSISGGKLSISCSGTGPLNGKSFSNGVLQ
jgi:hypothetical protein